MAELTWRVRARNIATDSENKIHDDAVARRYGFSGGLVPGVVVYGYLVHPVVEALGRDWLDRGAATVRLVSPCYDGEEISIRASAAEAGAGETAAFDLVAMRPDGTVCAKGRAALPRASGQRVDADRFPALPLPRPKLPATLDALPAGTGLGSLLPTGGHERLESFARDIGDELPLYEGPHALVHPGAVLGLANEILARSVALGPWIHAASDVAHVSALSVGEAVAVRGCVVESFERKGHEMAVLDVLVLAGSDRPVARIRHTAIVRPRVRA